MGKPVQAVKVSLRKGGTTERTWEANRSGPQSEACASEAVYGGKGIRTPDIQLAKLALYQLSYAPRMDLECRCRRFDCKWKSGILPDSGRRASCVANEVTGWKPVRRDSQGGRLPLAAAGALVSGTATTRAKEKCRTAMRPSGILESAIKQKLNCALPFRFSLSLGLFRFRGLNGISKTPKDFGLSRRPIQTDPARASSSCPIEFLLRKEVIQPQVPLRLPCYDFIPVTAHSVGRCFHCWLARALRLQVTSMM